MASSARASRVWKSWPASALAATPKLAVTRKVAPVLPVSMRPMRSRQSWASCRPEARSAPISRKANSSPPRRPNRSFLRQAARQGFAIDRDFAHRGIWTVAVAIPGVAPGYCLSASIFAGSRSEAALEGLGRELCALRDALLLGE